MFGRVLGRLAVTRAFGDFECKQISIVNEETGVSSVEDFVSNQPEVRITSLNKCSDDFLIIASDGLYDRFTSQECVSIVKQQLQSQGGPFEQDPLPAVKSLVEKAVEQRVNSDNTTAILVQFNTGIDEEAY